MRRELINWYKTKEFISKFWIYLFLGIGVVVTAAPFIWEISCSFKLNSEIFSFPLTLFPKNPTFSNYIRLIQGEEIPFLREFMNSCFVSVSYTILTLLISSLVGYGFAKFEFPGKRPLFIVVLVSIMIPQQALLVPLFLLMNTFKWTNTYYAVIIPGAFSAFGAFFMRQVMLSVPNDLIDAARIDGASELSIFLQIALPLARGGFWVLGVVLFLNSWNLYLWPVIVLRTEEMFTLPVGLATLLGLYKVEYGMLMAGAFLATLPIIIFFISRRRQFVAGLASGAFKF